MKRIPITAARRISDLYDYDQVIIFARKVGEGEHMTTYGVDKINCGVAAAIGKFLQDRILGWTK